MPSDLIMACTSNVMSNLLQFICRLVVDPRQHDCCFVGALDAYPLGIESRTKGCNLRELVQRLVVTQGSLRDVERRCVCVEVGVGGWLPARVSSWVSAVSAPEGPVVWKLVRVRWLVWTLKNDHRSITDSYSTSAPNAIEEPSIIESTTSAAAVMRWCLTPPKYVAACASA